MSLVAQLTQKQRRFYESLRKHIIETGESPTTNELMACMNLSSPRAVTQYLSVLEKKGLIFREKHAARGIRLREYADAVETVNIPVIASAGCDNVSVLAERNFGDFICVASDLLCGKRRDDVVSIKAIGDSMVDAGVCDSDYVLVELTQAVSDNDLVVTIVDHCAVIKKIQFANNAIVLHPVSSDPQYKPIILQRDYRIFGRVIDVIRMPQKGDLDIVPLYSSY
ncbi:MAG: repressor LexA [Candidatus Harrisonbacteria bacterium CG10_big_fil_rev_8_21_14_0_10_40_38]|uniref:Repressor LexA n=1 Tax=Candidatus Harrisonbacteria bacterium CG10_big_fil_rev_8_21_14_0_10_40_38 TaxID=1974583 RepID=A0A2H0UV20_9BACT|nr:MAG: repressor LexA [Candidatus Harrisonbacteria bacterium CG10_big_fil_rev_8_21_14_0_10_40_38]